MNVFAKDKSKKKKHSDQKKFFFQINTPGGPTSTITPGAPSTTTVTPGGPSTTTITPGAPSTFTINHGQLKPGYETAVEKDTSQQGGSPTRGTDLNTSTNEIQKSVTAEYNNVKY